MACSRLTWLKWFVISRWLLFTFYFLLVVSYKKSCCNSFIYYYSSFIRRFQQCLFSAPEISSQTHYGTKPVARNQSHILESILAPVFGTHVMDFTSILVIFACSSSSSLQCHQWTLLTLTCHWLAPSLQCCCHIFLSNRILLTPHQF